MAPQKAIRIEKLGKRYRLGERLIYKTLREDIASFFSGVSKRSITGRDEYIWALRNVSLEIGRGEVVGIVGRNGAGKTTLLKILSRITEPTEGWAELYGRVGSLLEVGTGFHSELTGRENIYFNGAILGMHKREIDRKFDAIVQFAEIGKFLDTPVKRYSSGMYVRLAFAVAAHLEPEILFVDEVLAVGDQAFQEKCLGKMKDVSKQGKTVLFVSHNLNAIWSICPHSIWLENGGVKAMGDTEEIVGCYRESLHLRDDIQSVSTEGRQGNGRLRILGIRFEDRNGAAINYARSGAPVVFALKYQRNRDVAWTDVEINLIVADDRENRLFVLNNRLSGSALDSTSEIGGLKCLVDSLPLIPGEYFLHLSCLVRGELADKVLYAGKFQVVEGDFFGTNLLPERNLGGVLVKHSWRTD